MVTARMGCGKASLRPPLSSLSPSPRLPPHGSLPFCFWSSYQNQANAGTMLLTSQNPGTEYISFRRKLPNFRYCDVAITENGLSYSRASMETSSSVSWGCVGRAKPTMEPWTWPPSKASWVLYCILPHFYPDTYFYSLFSACWTRVQHTTLLHHRGRHPGTWEGNSEQSFK